MDKADLKKFVSKMLELKENYYCSMLWCEMHLHDRAVDQEGDRHEGRDMKSGPSISVDGVIKKVMPTFKRNVPQFKRSGEAMFELLGVKDKRKMAELAVLLAFEDKDILDEVLKRPENRTDWDRLIKFLEDRFNQQAVREREKARQFLYSEERHRQGPKTPLYEHVNWWRDVVATYIAAVPDEMKETNMCVANGGRELIRPLIESVRQESIKVAARGWHLKGMFRSLDEVFDYLLDQGMYETMTPSDEGGLRGSVNQTGRGGRLRFYGQRGRCWRCGREGHAVNDCSYSKDV
jgi:hypothetical protein